jgi:DNA topoisomerase-6 subunit B
VQEEIPRVFAKLLYGSRFHTLRQSRGQQGIGISAAVLYSQLTSGRPTKVISKIAADRPARYCELLINTAKNEPEILKSEDMDWERPRGTRVELEMEGTYVRGRRQSVYGSLKSTAIVNPHARLTLVEPEGNVEVFERVTESLPKKAYAISPHPEGIELGELIKLLRYTDKKKLRVFLKETFSSIGAISAQELCSRAGLDPEEAPTSLDHDAAARLHSAFKQIKVKSPPVDCLSPIGEELIKAGLEKEYRLDYIATTVRPVSVYSGNPFLVEVGLGYGGELEKESRVELLRFANRVPLVYQQGACAITHAVESVSWKNYSLGQPTGSGVPVGPVVLLVHIASTNIPFTSESKDAVADMPEILAEIDLGMKEVARKLRRYLGRQSLLTERREKEEIIRKILPRIAQKLSDVLEKDLPDIGPVVAKIMGNLLVLRKVERNNGLLSVKILIENHSEVLRSFKLHEVLAASAESVSPAAKVVSLGDGYDYHWKLAIAPGQAATLSYSITAEGVALKEPVIEGLDAEIVTGARVI